MKIPFWKVQSIGNDFVLVHADEPALKSLEFRELAIRACTRRFGVGSDGLLVVGPEAKNTVSVRMFNPDGSEDFCGNGMRCSLLHAFGQGWVDEKPTIVHMGRRMQAHLVRDVLGGAPQIRFTLDSASYRPEDIPLDRSAEAFDTLIATIGAAEYRGSALSTGTAHTIIWRNSLPDDDEFFHVSPLLEHDPQFPERTSIMWTRENSPGVLSLRIWERGAGETKGCGTGSTAAAIDYLRRRGSGGEVVVNNPGGSLTISAGAWDQPPLVSGYAYEVYKGNFWF